MHRNSPTERKQQNSMHGLRKQKETMLTKGIALVNQRGPIFGILLAPGRQWCGGYIVTVSEAARSWHFASRSPALRSTIRSHNSTSGFHVNININLQTVLHAQKHTRRCPVTPSSLRQHCMVRPPSALASDEPTR